MTKATKTSSFLLRTSNLELLFVTAVAALTNFLYYALASRDYLFPDSYSYLGPARNLLRGAGFIDATGVTETLRTPGYPLLLAAFGTRIVPVIVAQHLMNAAIAAGIYLLAKPRLGRFVAMTAALLFAIDTPSIHYANKILSETLFTLVLLVICWLLIVGPFDSAQGWRWPWAGVLTGLLVLIRPVAIVYFLVVAAYMLLRRARPRQVVIYALLAVVLPVGWSARNWARTGVFTVSSISGTNLLLFRAGGVLAILDHGDDFESDRRDEAEGLIGDADSEIERVLHIDDATELPHAVRARYYARFALRVIRQHPLAFAELTLRGLLVNLFESRWEAMKIVSSLHGSVVKLAIDTYTVALFLFALLGAITLRRDDLGILIILTVAYFLLISAGGEAESRFRVPVMPAYAIAAAAGVDAVRRAAARPPR
jgi:4-amino-4-deoxy-L-arabinose transferase-like glycosyltransferase